MVSSPRTVLAAALTSALLLSAAARADDWPQWRGPNRDAVWNETGILESFPPGGLKVRWRAPVGWGYSSPVVAQGRVFLTDSQLAQPKYPVAADEAGLLLPFPYPKYSSSLRWHSVAGPEELIVLRTAAGHVVRSTDPLLSPRVHSNRLDRRYRCWHFRDYKKA